METILSVVIYLIQIAAISLVPAILVLILYKCLSKLKARLVSIIMLFAFVIGVTINTVNPPVFCSEEYKEFVGDNEIEIIQSFNNGIYSKNIPIIPVFIKVLYADDSKIKVRTYYFFAGTTEMEILNGEPSLTKYLSGLS